MVWTGLGSKQRQFQFLLSAMRQCIERAFGMFVGRWGIFRRPLTFGAQKWGLVLGVCAKLHNYCIRQGEAKPLSALQIDVQEGDEETVLDNQQNYGLTNKSGGVGSSLRRNITAAIGEWGQIRPVSNCRRNV
jgi:hypothetical protein